MNGKIRKLIVGNDPHNATVFVVGGKGGKEGRTISVIEFDERYFSKTSKVKYAVYISDGKEEWRWKDIEHQNCIVEYDCFF
jgi:hypothetical protein